ncbi:aarF domain-containing kinase 1 [Leptopilina heterotoma]|uniref:aarF domain-containing kinase 1 n=1 Tax=Leptopilina heterotoma TaxID=63436 RepID=UPI001CA87265|nr:aarF domain-containing kinase 1 [Leptopilina heterotoma]XP_043476925.1 aarF domain-containing kinase 1 [Leptopilina heterotoma]
MLLSRRLFKAAAIGTIGLGTFASLRANEYDIGSIGIVRLGRAAVTVFVIGNYYQKHLYKAKVLKGTEEYETLKSEAHKFGAQKLLELCCANKGVYIKVGQHIGALDYLLPQEYVTKLRILHSAAPQSSFNDVLTVIKEDFKKDPYEIFDSIEKDPLGTASLAQVHKAILKNGTSVAVKVQHRSVKTNAYVDVKTMATLVKITSWIFPDFKFDWLVEETQKNIPRELDFTQEGRNAEKLENLFKDYHWLKIPKIYWDISSSRVLTMEFMEGGQINDVDYLKKNGVNFFEVTNKLGRLYSHMIFITGFVHSDPHPGNILVKKNGSEADIILLDHGLYADLTNEFRWEYSKLWLAILDGDKDAMKEHCTKLGVGDFYGLLSCMVSGRTWDTIIHGVQKKKYSKTEKELFQKEIPNLLPQISNVLQKVDRQMLLILKTNDLIRCIEYTLNTQSRMNAFMEMSKCCVKSVYGEKFKYSQTNLSRCKLSFSEQWTLFKLSLYYVYLGVLNFNILKCVDSLRNKDFYPI